MTITLTVGATSLELPADLYWSDESTWSGVEQEVSRSITGALIVQVAAAIGGRPITLQPEDEGSAWMERAALEQLQAWAGVAGLELLLDLRGVARLVMFRHQDKPVLEAEPIVHYSDVSIADQYRVTLKFMEV